MYQKMEKQEFLGVFWRPRFNQKSVFSFFPLSITDVGGVTHYSLCCSCLFGFALVRWIFPACPQERYFFCTKVNNHTVLLGFVYSATVFGALTFLHFAIYFSFILSMIEVGWMIIVCALGSLIGKEHYELRKHKAL